MNNVIQLLPGIRAIAWIDCNNIIPGVALWAAAGATIPVLTDFNAVEFVGEPECKLQREFENNGAVETATLKFNSTQMLPQSGNIGFIVTDQQGRSLLIGAKESPHPIVKVTATAGKPDGDAAGFTYEITHKALKTLVECHT